MTGPKKWGRSLPPEDCEFFRGAAMREIEEGRSVYCSTEQQNLVHALMNDFELYNVQLGELLDGAEALGCTEGTVRWYSPIGPCDWNPDGETLPSEPQPVRIPLGLERPLSITLHWDPVPRVAEYRISAG